MRESGRESGRNTQGECRVTEHRVTGVAELTGSFHIGQIVMHRRFGYRGVIYDVDPRFMLSEQWYEQVARSRPPKDRPWYHVLVDNADRTTYVAERNLRPSSDRKPIQSALLDNWFHAFNGKSYEPRLRCN